MDIVAEEGDIAVVYLKDIPDTMIGCGRTYYQGSNDVKEVFREFEASGFVLEIDEDILKRKHTVAGGKAIIGVYKESLKRAMATQTYVDTGVLSKEEANQWLTDQASQELMKDAKKQQDVNFQVYEAAQHENLVLDKSSVEAFSKEWSAAVAAKVGPKSVHKSPPRKAPIIITHNEEDDDY